MLRLNAFARDASGNRAHQALEAVNRAGAGPPLRSHGSTALSIVEDTAAPPPALIAP